ncbi:cupin domain-containing protein [Roseovarius indicus]|uniref:cupin domain-containing protein n=1 Tax=Roseovarius indicus TaxID=540747 RepID=UPI004059E4FF
MREDKTPEVVDFGQSPKETSRRCLADLPGRVVEGDPRHETNLHFRSEDGALIAGSWTSTPGRWHAFTDRDEFCHILSGRGALISQDGTRMEFGSGSSFLIPDGFRGFWEITETTTKHFVIRDRA